MHIQVILHAFKVQSFEKEDISKLGAFTHIYDFVKFWFRFGCL